MLVKINLYQKQIINGSVVLDKHGLCTCNCADRCEASPSKSGAALRCSKGDLQKACVSTVSIADIEITSPPTGIRGIVHAVKSCFLKQSADGK